MKTVMLLVKANKSDHALIHFSFFVFEIFTKTSHLCVCIHANHLQYWGSARFRMWSSMHILKPFSLIQTFLDLVDLTYSNDTWNFHSHIDSCREPLEAGERAAFSFSKIWAILSVNKVDLDSSDKVKCFESSLRRHRHL